MADIDEKIIKDSLSNSIESLKDLPLWNQIDSHTILLETCKEYEIHPDVISKLVSWNREKIGAARRYGLTADFNEIFTDKTLWNE